MRGYFGIGVEGISKPMNFGAVMRTAHAFGASFTFSVDARHLVKEIRQSDTSAGDAHLPYYDWSAIDDLVLPRGCELVGVELTDDAVVLPRFHHPRSAAYILGPERGDLSQSALARCRHVVKIPTKFCINVGLAAALVCYDRLICHGGYPPRLKTTAPAPLPADGDWVAPESDRL